MNFKNNNQIEHDFFTSLGYDEKQYGYVRHNANNSTQVITPFDDYTFQIWAEPSDVGDKIYNTGIVKFDGFPQLQSVVLLFEQIKDGDDY